MLRSRSLITVTIHGAAGIVVGCQDSVGKDTCSETAWHASTKA